MSDPTQEILGPAHPRWAEFVNKLERAIVISKQPLEWRCDGDHRATRQVLREMGAELDQTLTYFESCAAGCDCAVLGQLAWEK
jgi:hypothetical protein